MSVVNHPLLEFGPSVSHGTRRVPVDQDLGVSDPVVCDDTVTRLLTTATAAVHSDRRLARNCVQHAATLLGLEFRSGAGGNGEGPCRPRGGLAPWQIKRLKEHIEDKLDSVIRVEDLANFARLSTSHFHRAFRKAFGQSPAAYVKKRRIWRAQELMLSSRMSLSQVALACGMYDQAHFSRVFRRIVGSNPAIWRRQLRSDLESHTDTALGTNLSLTREK